MREENWLAAVRGWLWSSDDRQSTAYHERSPRRTVHRTLHLDRRVSKNGLSRRAVFWRGACTDKFAMSTLVPKGDIQWSARHTSSNSERT